MEISKSAPKMQIQNASFIHFTLEPLEEYQQICISMPYCHID